jgi:hypothetical protein
MFLDRALRRFETRRSDAVVHVELDRMGRGFEAHDVFHLEVDVTVDEIVGENIALLEVVAVGREAVDRFAQAGAHGRHVFQFLRRQIVEVLVHGIAGMDLVFDAVQARHQHRREGEVGVGRGIGEADLDAFALRRGGKRDTAGSRTVARAVGEQNRSFVAGHQTLVAVGRGVGEGIQRLGVFDDAADVIERHLREVGVSVAGKQRLAVLPDRLMHMHARTVVEHDGLGHERGGLAVRVRDAVHDILVGLHEISAIEQGAEGHAELMLAGADLMVVFVDRDTHGRHGRQHFAAQFAGGIDRGDREVAALGARTMGEVAVFVMGVVVVGTFLAVQAIAHGVGVGGETHAVEDEKLQLRSEKGGVADAGIGEIGLGTFGGGAGITLISLARGRLQDIAVEDQGGLGLKRVHDGRSGVGHQRHVAFVDRLPAGDRGAVEHDAVGEGVLVDHAGGHGQMLPLALGVGETQVDIGNLFVLDFLQDTGGIGHRVTPGKVNVAERRVRLKG